MYAISFATDDKLTEMRLTILFAVFAWRDTKAHFESGGEMAVIGKTPRIANVRQFLSHGRTA